MSAPRCGTLRGYQRHTAAGQQPCPPCEDALALDGLDRALAGTSWPADRVRLSLLIERRRDLVGLSLIGPRIAAGISEGV